MDAMSVDNPTQVLDRVLQKLTLLQFDSQAELVKLAEYQSQIGDVVDVVFSSDEDVVHIDNDAVLAWKDLIHLLLKDGRR